MSQVACGMSQVACGMSHEACRKWHVTCGMWHVTSGMSHVASVMWHVACGMWHVLGERRHRHVKHAREYREEDEEEEEEEGINWGITRRTLCKFSIMYSDQFCSASHNIVLYVEAPYGRRGRRHQRSIPYTCHQNMNTWMRQMAERYAATTHSREGGGGLRGENKEDEGERERVRERGREREGERCRLGV